MTLIPVVSALERQAVSQLADEIWHQHYPSIISTTQIDYMLATFQSPQAIAEQIETGYRYFLIFGHSSELQGYLSININIDERSLFLSKFYLLEQFRGQGLARKALFDIERMAQDAQLESIYLTVNKNNRIALNAYQKMGFVVVDDIVTDIGAGYVMDDYKMLKKLN